MHKTHIYELVSLTQAYFRRELKRNILYINILIS